MTEDVATDEGAKNTDRNMVLVVDDDPAQRRDLADYLRHKGIRVVEIADGALAVREIDRLKPALVLMDYVMPGCDGVRAAKFAQMLSPATMIVLMSGHAEVDNANMALPCPLQVFHKPLVLSQISDFVMHVLGEAGVSRRAPEAAAGADGYCGFRSADRS